jgi:hypothetical protein
LSDRYQEEDPIIWKCEETGAAPNKRSQPKSKSPPSITTAGEDQSGKPKVVKKKIPPRSKDQVPLSNVFDRLIRVFSHLDNLERVQEVCTQEKGATLPVKPPSQKGKKLRCNITLDP